MRGISIKEKPLGVKGGSDLSMYFDFSNQQHCDWFVWSLTKMTRNREDALDLFQDICEYMLAHPEKSLLYSQVKIFAINRYRNQIKRAKKTSCSIDTVEGLTQIEEVCLKQGNVIETSLEIKEEIEKLLYQIEKFPDKDRIPFKLYYLDCLTYNEIAIVTCKPLGTIKSNIHRSLRKLRRQNKRS